MRNPYSFRSSNQDVIRRARFMLKHSVRLSLVVALVAGAFLFALTRDVIGSVLAAAASTIVYVISFRLAGRMLLKAHGEEIPEWAQGILPNLRVRERGARQ
jgi:hypothetical protein